MTNPETMRNIKTSIEFHCHFLVDMQITNVLLVTK